MNSDFLLYFQCFENVLKKLALNAHFKETEAVVRELTDPVPDVRARAMDSVGHLAKEGGSADEGGSRILCNVLWPSFVPIRAMFKW